MARHLFDTARLRLQELEDGDADFVAELLNTEGFLRNIGDRERVNKVRRQFWRGTPPASTLVEVVNRLQLPIKATGLADTRTLIIPVAHTIFWEAGPAVRATMGIADGMIRLSIGLEDPQDLLADFAQALAGL